MKKALELAAKAGENDEVPVGAVIVYDGRIIATAQNEMKKLKDITAHAEMRVIKRALKILDVERLKNCDLYVTLEPCTMCAGAISLAKIRRVYYGAQDEKGGAIDNGVRFFETKTCHHKPEVIGGICEEESANLLRQFFAKRR